MISKFIKNLQIIIYVINVIVVLLSAVLLTMTNMPLEGSNKIIYASNLSNENNSESSLWVPIPLRTLSQKSAGLTGGEGMQMVFGIKYAPSDPNIVYAIGDTSQVWKSTDGGDSWSRKSNGFLSKGGISIGIQPNDANTVFVAGSLHAIDWVTPPKAIEGIFRTKDGGDNWKLVKKTSYARDHANDLFAFAEKNIVYAATQELGILVSLDGGDNWQSVTTTKDTKFLLDTKITDIKKHPKNNEIF
ncbi:MAG TPA: WD40/YVTN/BNR-like repeat-containing protein, partial [Candidatus Wunengus sp. YC60]|uniref:WD40/YVTN/BNR-like repeat-containing protein n=1 Tax=Candidatus Wunengus sp. YC60 TaxID=3367697 RepID=UPI004029A7FD